MLVVVIVLFLCLVFGNNEPSLLLKDNIGPKLIAIKDDNCSRRNIECKDIYSRMGRQKVNRLATGYDAYSWFRLGKEISEIQLMENGVMRNVTRMQHKGGSESAMMNLKYHMNRQNPPCNSKYSGNGDDQRPIFRILSFNIWNFNANWTLRSKAIANVVNESNVDIVGWQEVRVNTKTGENQLERLVKLLPQFPYYVYQRAMIYDDGFEEGLAIMSKFPIVEASTLLLPSFWDIEDSHQRIVLRALVQLSCSRFVHVMVTHLSLSDAGRLKQTNEIAKWSEALYSKDGLPQVLLGDLNTLPNSHTLKPLLDNFVDVWNTNVPQTSCCCRLDKDNANEDIGMTFPTWEPKKRIDFVMLKGKNIKPCEFQLSAMCSQVGGNGEEVYPSDHRAVMVELQTYITNKKTIR